MRFKEVR